MNTKLKEVFSGKVVNKAHTINTGVDEFPRYVLEYLIDNCCAEESFHEDMQKVVRRLKELPAFASLVFVGNLDVQGKLPHEKYYHLFEPLPDFMQVIAFLDRNVRLSGVFEKRRYPQGMFDFAGMSLIL